MYLIFAFHSKFSFNIRLNIVSLPLNQCKLYHKLKSFTMLVGVV